MAKTEPVKWEKRLNIATTAADYEKDDANHSRYEPTSYAVLERFAQSGYVGSGDLLVDYGCGKGRVSFFMSHMTHCRSVGVEYDARLYGCAMKNLEGYAGKNPGIFFACEDAARFDADGATCFYFFNPFSVKILRSVLGRIYESYYSAPRKLRLFFYYATDPYLECLMTEDMLVYEGDVDCRDIFFGEDEREKILVFSVGAH